LRGEERSSKEKKGKKKGEEVGLGKGYFNRSP